MFDKIKKRFQTPKKQTKSTPVKPKQTEKEIADKKGEPYVAILGMEVDPQNLHQGSFELDWNEKFVANLIRAGYRGETDADIVDQWFQTVCRHVVMETYDQYDAMDHETYVHTRNLGNGRKEIS